jgi:hypothetical protein
MEFGIGFLTGGLVTGFAAAKSGFLLRTGHAWLTKAEAAAKRKIAAKAESFKLKL